MAFREHLQEVCRGVDGAVACSLMGMDGIEVDTHVQAPPVGGVDMPSLLVELTAVLRGARDAAQAHQVGGVTEFSVGTERLVTVGRLVSPEYFMVVALRPEANLGKARYLLRVTAPRVLAEL
jgi:predicted regulator of Ras-like GTPase activity (Roadblock/LC7/MglB family)